MCIFCKIISGEFGTEFLHEDQKVLAFRDLAPLAPTHILIIPRGHYENVEELAVAEPETLAALFEIATNLAQSEGISGHRTVFNTGKSAGQSVFHAHLHLLGGRSFAWPPG
jgi:histidine triad (HIT) family protein